ncbi:MAG TPA: ATP-binding protein [Ramlibacter sp.]|nr:ATP-binding protein [Ramlibacter sp.]
MLSSDAVPSGVSRDLRSLRLFIAGCALLAIAAFAAFAVHRHDQLMQETEVRLSRALTIAHEHALRLLDTNDTLAQNVLLLVRQQSSEQLRQREPELHALMRDLQRNKEPVQSIWLVGPDGRSLASSRFAQVPADRDVSAAPYFQWHRDGRGGVFASSVMQEPKGQRFFNISRGAYRTDGTFAGLVSVGMYAAALTRFHQDLAADEPGLAITVFRDDGLVYSRWPELPNAPERMGRSSEVLQRVLRGETSGAVRNVSSLDQQRRVILFRKLGGYPIYIGVGREFSAVRQQWLGELGRLAALGVLPALGMIWAAYVALRRTREALQSARRLQEEAKARQLAEAALFQSQKLEALGRLTGGVAHDFNNALMVISGNLHLLRLSGAPAQARNMDAIARAVQSATQLTRQLLAFSRRQALAPQAIDLQERLPALRDLLVPTLGSQIALSIEVEPGTPPIYVDPAELELGLINVAVNARDAMPGGGSFALRAGHDPSAGTVWIEAVDTGEGMDEETLRKAFDPFFTTKPLGKGTGLGLSQVQALCRRAGGDAAIRSARGQGTQVRLTFPASQAAAAPAGRAAPRQVRLDRTVLVVEDNHEVAAVVLPVLQALGCRTVHHASPELALGWLHQNARGCDLLLTDVVMPGRIDGVKLAGLVREQYPHIRVLLMTGYAEQIDAITALGYQVVSKPFEPEALAGILERLFAVETTG